MKGVISKFVSKKVFFLFILIANLFFFGRAYATHIVGGELNYRYLGGNNYQIRLTVYRDCFNGVPDFDNPAVVGFFDAGNSLQYSLSMPFISKIQIPPIINSPCLVPPANVCYEVSVYLDTINLPPLAGGYQMAYQRCCRNNTINNIVNPGNAGGTYYAKIPSPGITTNNSNPVFVNLPPTFICRSLGFTFNHAAFDYDGDSLVYSLVTPLDGASTGNPMPVPPNPPPYSNVTFQAPYSLSNVLGGVPMTINSQTGFLTATPNTVGQFVYGVSVKEYRNGLYLGETRREFQVNVINCVGLVVASIQSPVILCGSFTASFQNSSIGAASYHWDFGVSSLTNDTSNLFSPNYTYPATGTYFATLIARSATNPLCNDTSIAVVNVFPALVADIGKLNDKCINSVFFWDSTLTTSGTPNQWLWNFGDGSTSTAQNNVHTYLSTGTFIVTLNVTTNAGCSDLVTDTVTIFPLLTADIDSVIPATCPTVANGIGIVAPHGGTPPYHILWSNGDTLAVADSLFPGTYSVQVTDSNGCIFSNSIDINYTFNTLISNVQAAVCDSFCNGTATILAGGGTNPYTYLWSNADTNAVADSLCSGKYYVTATDSNGCQLTDSVIIQTSFVTAIVDSAMIKCFGDCNGGATVFATGGTNPYIFNWNDGQSGAIASNLCPGIYVVTTVDLNGCVEKDTIEITQPDLLVDSAAKQDAKCPLECDGKGFSSPQGGTVPYGYSWDGTFPQVFSNVNNLCPGWHTIMVTDNNGCETKDSIEIITSYTSPVIDTHSAKDTIYLGETTQLFSNPGSGYTYLWDNASSLNDVNLADPNAAPTATITYVLKVTDANGCPNFDTLTVYVITDYCKESSVYVPNAFSPDGDGHNDKFYIRAKGINSVQFSIYNRWGEQVYRTTDISQGWDGTYKGKDAPADVYVYYLTVECFDKNKNFKKGNVTLIR